MTGKKQILLLTAIFILIISMVVSAESLLEDGIEEYNNGDYRAAIDYLTSYAAENNDSYLSHFYLGLSYTKLSQYGLAIDSFNFARELRGDSYNLLVNLGRAYYNSNDKDKAYDVLLKAKGYPPIDEQVYNLLGLIHMDKREYSEAIENFERGIELEKNNYFVYNNLSLCYIHLGNYSEGRKYINEALELDPEVPFVFNNAGIIYENLNQFEQASKYYKKAIEIDPDYKKAEINLERVVNKISEEE